jgi:hypothetical protein
MESRTFNLRDDAHVMRVFTEVRDVILGESDRGAVLVGADVVNRHLQLLIERLLPDDMRDKATTNRLFNYPGMLSSFAARTDFARAAEMIGPNVYESIQKLRKLRNEVAHSLESFRLTDYQQTLGEMAELSDSMAEFISVTAREVVMADVVARMKALTLPGPSGEGLSAFSGVSDIINRIAELPESDRLLLHKATKLEFALIIGYICGFLAAHREMPLIRRHWCPASTNEGDDKAPRRATLDTPQASSDLPSATES